MKKFQWLSIAIFLITVCSLLPLSSASAAQADSWQPNLEQLTNGADAIVVGTVVERSSYWNDEHTRIYTSVVMSVEDRLKGTPSQDRVAITVEGGEVEGIGEWVSNMPSFVQGEKSVVFLKKLAGAQLPQAAALPARITAEQFEIYDGFRGKFPVKGDKVDGLPVAQFKGRINSILAGQALPAAELYIAPSAVTMPYVYAGYNWPHPPAPVIPYRVYENTPDATGELAAVQSAAQTWSAAGASFSFSYAGTTAATAHSYDGVNEVMWVNLGNVSTLAQTWIWYNDITHIILENDVEFNDYYNWSTSPSCPSNYFDVQTVGLHELGHWLCLADLYSPGDADKVMYGYGSSGTTKRALTADDTAGIQSIYGIPAPLSITTTTLPDGEIGVAYSQTLLASGGSESYTWSITSGLLPDGLSLTPASGLISGTPTTAATSPFTAQVNDGSTTATQPLSITVTVPLQKLLGADDAAAAGTAGANYLLLDRFAAVASGDVTRVRVKCTASGSVKVALYTDSAGSPGTLLNANNTGASVVTGWNNITIPATPVTTGTYYWIAYNSSSNCVGNFAFSGGSLLYRAFGYSNNFPASAGTGFTNYAGHHSLIAGWGVAGPTPLAITTTSLPDGVVGVAYSQTLQAIGGSGSYTWSITGGSLPDGLSLTPSTGLISGTPTTAATSNFTAQVNDGSTTVTQPLSITVTVPLQKLLGADDAVATGTAGANYLLVDRFAAVATGNVSQIRVKCTASGSVKVALYADNAGSPGTLLNANNTGAGCIAGWNNITIPSTAVTMGTYYWIAYNSSSNCVGNFAFSGGSLLYRAFSYSNNFPASAGTGFTNYADHHSLVAGWGVVIPPPLPDPPSLLSPGTAITFKWGTSTGATTYWLQVNTASDFTGTNMFNADVANVTTQEVTGLSLGTAYYWRVKAGNSSGWSNWSTVRSVISAMAP